MNSKNLLSLFSLLAVAAIFVVSSCSKRDFDQPPVGGDIVTNVVANYTIGELKAAHIIGKFDSVKTDLIIKGVVIADDASGNFYKQLFIQDATGGIEILLNATGLYADFPVGREVFVKLNGLFIGDYQGLPQIGGYVFVTNGSPQVEGIPANLISKYVLKGERGKFVTPKTTTINALTTADFQTLVTVTDAQFVKADTGQTYADYIGKNSSNRTIEDCSGGKMTFRSSGYATFASVKMPSKKGTATGVIGAFSNKPQMLMRELTDVIMADGRCGTGGGGNPGTGLVNQNFTGLTVNSDVSISGWTNWSPISGGRLWSVKAFSGNNFAECEAYNDPKPSTEAWLITPAISLAAQRTLTFTSAMAFYKHAGLTVLFSSNFDGTNVAAATWTPLAATLADSGSTNYVEIPSGNVVIPAGTGNGFVAFKYVGVAGTNTTKFRIDNVVVQ